MGTFYSRRILPRLIDFALKNDDMTALRRRMIPLARGVVLEAGIGSGLNLPFYSSEVTKLIGIDPSVELLAMARSKLDDVGFPVELVPQSADTIPLPDNVVDTIVMTWSLCSIGDPIAALREMRRVLEPDGSLIFIEHGLSDEPRVRSWQNRLTPMWRRVAGGCHLNRRIDDLIQAGGFSTVTLETQDIRGPKPFTHTFMGVARIA